MTKTDEVPCNWLDYVEQGEWWRPNGRPWIRISEMDKPWRYNASRWMERNAARVLGNATHTMMNFLIVYGSDMTEMTAKQFDDEFGRLIDSADDPVRWVRDTVLYRALTGNLPTKRAKLKRLAAKAGHWATCPARKDLRAECRCGEIREVRRVISDALAKAAEQAGVHL